MKTQLFIPDKIKVGYNEREDTYTKKLAYVIYYDQKGVLRKETSWKNWIQEEMGINDFDNVPTEGFVLNKGVGGARESYGWNSRNEYIRIFDPRGFEFEISVANLLWLLQECTSIKGKGLVGEFVYSWEGKELVLLPVDTMEYKNCQSYTKLQSGKITSKDLEPGNIYLDNKQRKLVYLGKYEYYDNYYHSHSNTSSKKFIFINLDQVKDEYHERIVSFSSLTTIKERITFSVIDGYAELLSEYLNESIYSSAFDKFIYLKITSDELTDLDKNNYWYNLNMDGHSYNIRKTDDISKQYEISNYNGYSSTKEYLTRTEVLEKMTKEYSLYKNGYKK